MKEAAMKRYQRLSNFVCMVCRKWLGVMSPEAAYTGEIVCSSCGAQNIFKDSNKPVEAIK